MQAAGETATETAAGGAGRDAGIRPGGDPGHGDGCDGARIRNHGPGALLTAGAMMLRIAHRALREPVLLGAGAHQAMR